MWKYLIPTLSYWYDYKIYNNKKILKVGYAYYQAIIASIDAMIESI